MTIYGRKSDCKTYMYRFTIATQQDEKGYKQSHKRENGDCSGPTKACMHALSINIGQYDQRDHSYDSCYTEINRERKIFEKKK